MAAGKVFLLIISLAFVACSAGENRVEQGNRDGILHFGNGTEPQGIDPHVTTGVPERNIQLAIFEGLTSLSPNTLEPLPGVAESWDVSEDGRVYRFYLRKDAKWSNGESMTAEDFRWSWWRALQPALGNLYVYMLYPILNAEAYASGELADFEDVGVKALDAHTLEVRLTEPTPYFLQLLDHHVMYPVHRATIESHGNATDRYTAWTRPENIVTNGAFTLTEWKLNKRIVVSKNANYWDSENVRLNGVVFYPTENVTAEERMFRAGQLHKSVGVPLNKIPVYRDSGDPSLRIEPYLGTYYYRFNTTKAPLDDVRVRHALAMTIDRDLLIESVLYGVVTAAYAITPPGTLGYQPPKLFDFDPSEARKLLDEAGYPNGEGFPVIELLYNTSESHRKIAVAVQQMWKKHLNIDVSLVNQEWKVYLDTVNQLNYDVSRAGWIGDYVDPNNFLDMWITDGGNNRTGWSNAEYDKKILQDIPKITDKQERNEAFYEAEKLFLESMPIIPIYTYSNNQLVDPSVKGMPSNLMDHYSFKHIYLEP